MLCRPGSRHYAAFKRRAQALKRQLFNRSAYLAAEGEEEQHDHGAREAVHLSEGDAEHPPQGLDDPQMPDAAPHSELQGSIVGYDASQRTGEEIHQPKGRTDGTWREGSRWG